MFFLVEPLFGEEGGGGGTLPFLKNTKKCLILIIYNSHQYTKLSQSLISNHSHALQQFCHECTKLTKRPNLQPKQELISFWLCKWTNMTYMTSYARQILHCKPAFLDMAEILTATSHTTHATVFCQKFLFFIHTNNICNGEKNLKLAETFKKKKSNCDKFRGNYTFSIK